MNLLEFFKGCFFVLSLVFVAESFAAKLEFKPGSFYYIKATELNLRAGPDKRYPIRWVIKNRGEPVVVLMEFDGWVKIKDIDKDEGWVHNSMLNSVKHGILVGTNSLEFLRSGPSEVSKPIARLEPGIRFSVKKCINNEWCSISLEGLKGWIPKRNIWGIE